MKEAKHAKKNPRIRGKGPIALLRKTIPATQFELGFRFAAIYLILPFFSLIMHFTYRLAGYNYVRSDNLSSILKNPLSVLYFIIILIIYGFMTLYEISMLMHLTKTEMNPADLGLRQLSKLALRQNLSFMRKHPGAFLFILIFFAPLFSISFSSPLMPDFQLPGFIMDSIFQSTLFTLLFIAAILLLVLLALASIFTFHGIYLDNLSLAKSLRQSMTIFRKHGLRIFWRILWVESLLFFIIGIVTVSAMFLLGFTIAGQIEHQRRLIVLLALSASLKTMGQWILGAFSTALFIALTTRLYREYAFVEDQTEPLMAAEMEEETTAIVQPAPAPEIKRKKSRLRWLLFMPLIFVTVLSFEGLRIYLLLNSDYVETANAPAIMVSAHRGNIQNAPENTKAAVQEAINVFADYVEIDVQLSRDGQVVVFHDSTLKRLTGDKRRVDACTFAELQQLRFLPNYAKKYPDEKIPLLYEVLELGKGKIRFNIELKPSDSDSSALAAGVVKTIKDLAMEDKVLVASLRLDALKHVKTLAPELRSMYILPFVKGDFYTLEEIDYYSIEENNISEDLVNRLHDGGHQVHAWTVNDEDQMLKLADLQVDNIITDYPLIAKETLTRNTPEQRIDAQIFDWILPVIEIFSVQNVLPELD